MLFLHVTTRIEGRKDDGLLGKVGGQGFPHVVAMDDGGKVISVLDWQKRTIEGFQGLMKDGAAFIETRAKAEKGDEAAKVAYFSQALKLAHFTLEEGRKYYATLKDVPADKKAEIEGLLATVEMRDVLAPVIEERDQTKRTLLIATAGKKLWEMDRGGRVPPDEDSFRDFYAIIVIYAEKEKDIPALEKGIAKLKERLGDKLKRFLEPKEAALKKMKEEKEAPKEEPKEPPKDPK